MKTRNPLFTRLEAGGNAPCQQSDDSKCMTLNGAISKAVLLLVLVTVSAGLAWFTDSLYGRTPTRIIPILEVFLVSFPIPFIVVGFTLFHKEWSPITAPIFAILQGCLLGYVAAIFEDRFPGILIQSVFLTTAMFAGIIMAYRSHLVSPSSSLRNKLYSVMCGVLLYYIVNYFLVLAGCRSVPVVTAGIPGIIAGVLILAIASVSLIFTIDTAVKCAEWTSPTIHGVVRCPRNRGSFRVALRRSSRFIFTNAESTKPIMPLAKLSTPSFGHYKGID